MLLYKYIFFYFQDHVVIGAFPALTKRLGKTLERLQVSHIPNKNTFRLTPTDNLVCHVWCVGENQSTQGKPVPTRNFHTERSGNWTITQDLFGIRTQYHSLSQCHI